MTKTDIPSRLVSANAVLLALTALYTASPIDLIPDFIPILGWADDGAGWLATLTFTAYTAWRVHRAGGLTALRARGASPARQGRADERAPARASDIPGYEPLSYDEIRAL